jgi:hypothetical protein
MAGDHVKPVPEPDPRPLTTRIGTDVEPIDGQRPALACGRIAHKVALMRVVHDR